jgi:hypothetical protein
MGIILDIIQSGRKQCIYDAKLNNNQGSTIISPRTNKKRDRNDKCYYRTNQRISLKQSNDSGLTNASLLVTISP